MNCAPATRTIQLFLRPFLLPHGTYILEGDVKRLGSEVDDMVHTNDIKGSKPLDYRSFVKPWKKRRDRAIPVYWKNKSKLAELFEKNLWFYGEALVDLADMEELEPSEILTQPSVQTGPLGQNIQRPHPG